jgi:hypothetical protein
MQKPIRAISEKFLAALARHSWPGNVRELQNFIERSVILATGAVLNDSLSELTYTVQDRSKSPKSSAPVTLEQAQRSHILQTLLQTEGAVGGPNGAAARLGMPRTTLVSKMMRLGISASQNGQRSREQQHPWHELEPRWGGGEGTGLICRNDRLQRRWNRLVIRAVSTRTGHKDGVGTTPKWTRQGR